MPLFFLRKKSGRTDLDVGLIQNMRSMSRDSFWGSEYQTQDLKKRSIGSMHHFNSNTAIAHLQPADMGWPTGNRKKRSNCPACCLAQLCLAAAMFLSISCGPSYVRRLYFQMFGVGNNKLWLCPKSESRIQRFWVSPPLEGTDALRGGGERHLPMKLGNFWTPFNIWLRRRQRRFTLFRRGNSEEKNRIERRMDYIRRGRWLEKQFLDEETETRNRLIEMRECSFGR